GDETEFDIDDPEAFEVGSVISVGTSNNSGAGHLVTAKSGSTLTVTPSVSGAQSDGADVAAFAPSETVAGAPIAGILGSFEVDSVEIPITTFDLTIKNNFAPFNDEFGS